VSGALREPEGRPRRARLDARAAERYWSTRVDLGALLAALVVLPESYSRNRFYGLYRWPAARRVRRRATLLRSLLADLLAGRAEGIETAQSDAGTVVRYRMTAVGGRRRTLLADDEVALLGAVLRWQAHAAERASRTAARAARLLADLGPFLSRVDAAATSRIEPLLARLLGEAKRGEPRR
jgi:hypothetical protein